MDYKILIITHQLSRTGAPLVLVDMAMTLMEAGYEIEVISLLEGELREWYESRGVKVSIKDDFYHDRENFAKFARGFGVVIANTLITYQVIHALNGMHIPVIWWLHEGEAYFDYFSKVLPDFSKLSSNIQVYAVSSRIADIIKSLYSVEIPILHLGVQDESIADYSIDRNNDKVVFVTVGMYSPLKGQDILADAIANLSDDFSRACEFYLYGNEDVVDEDIYSKVTALCRTHDNIHMNPPIEHDKLLEVISRADYVLVPSRYDSMPTIAAEAMMCGRPCVITDSCGVSDYIDDAISGIVVKALSVSDLVDGIKRAHRIYSDKESYVKMCKASRKIYDDNFSMEVFRPKVMEIVQKAKASYAGKLIFTTGVYDIIDIFTYELIPAFERLGYETFIFDTNDMVMSLGKLYDFIKTPVKACIMFNNLGFNSEITEGQNLWEALGIPCINILMDHPMYHKAALDDAPSGAVVLCPDRNHMRYMQRFYPSIQTVGFLGHGGKFLPDMKRKPISNRSIDILYAGGISRGYALRNKPDFSKYDFDAESIGKAAYDAMLINPSLTTEGTLEAELISRGINLTDEKLKDFFADMSYVDMLIVSHFREKVIRTLAESGLQITLYGVGWDVCEWIQDTPTLDYRGRISADGIVELMHDAKIVLSTMTWFKDGTHDRVFNGMLSGAVAATDSSAYMRETFSDDELVMFELTEIDTLPNRIKTLLSDYQMMQTIADTGFEKARCYHTWESRANELHEDLLKYM